MHALWKCSVVVRVSITYTKQHSVVVIDASVLVDTRLWTFWRPGTFSSILKRHKQILLLQILQNHAKLVLTTFRFIMKYFNFCVALLVENGFINEMRFIGIKNTFKICIVLLYPNSHTILNSI